MNRGAAPWWIHASLGASALIAVSLLWDYSWHITVGRDTFWTPAHIGLYLGSVLGGGLGLFLVIRATGGPEGPTTAGVHLAGLRGPLGAWVLLWGAGAMLAAAPFDDWWHKAYGLDVRIFTPPHLLLLVGMTGLALGAVLLHASFANRVSSDWPARLRLSGITGAGLLVAMGGFIGGGYLYRTFMHSSNFYLIAALVFPTFLLGATAAGGRWPMTGAATVYMAVTLLMVWLLPLFPAEPRLGPVHFRPAHFVPPNLPVLLVAPALVLDLSWPRLAAWPPGRSSLVMGAVFVAALLAVQWPFGDFLTSPSARTWVFAPDNFRYNLSPASYTARREFYPWDPGPVWLIVRLALAMLLAAVSFRVGLGWRRLLREVRR